RCGGARGEAWIPPDAARPCPGGGPESRGRGVDAWPGRRGAVPGALQVPGTGEAGRVATRWALPLGCAMGISSVAGPRMRPLALSGLRGWRVAARWALPLGCAMGIPSVAGPRMRPLALSGLRGWRGATRWALPPGCVMDISSVAGPRMRPLALSGLRGWRVATRGRYRWAA